MEGNGMNADGERTGNQLLDSLTPPERDALCAGAERRPIPVGTVRRNPGDAIDVVIFPISGTYSIIVAPEEDGVETATIGREGMVDAHGAIGSGIASEVLLGQVPGESIDVSTETFLKVYEDRRGVRSLVHRYIEAAFAETAYSAGCLALHHVNQRCARWLLETHDRVDSDTFELKQEFLAMMLAVTRPSVSIAAGALQEAGTITYRRGKITIVNREALEDASCSCYSLIRAQYSRLVPLESSSQSWLRN